MKKTLWFLLAIVLILAAVVYFNYPKLNLISGYSAKMAASSIFVADRSIVVTDASDLDFEMVELADDVLHPEDKSVTATVFGLMERKAVYREGMGAVLTNPDYELPADFPVPNRIQKINDSLPFPYGTAPVQDSIFPGIDYDQLRKGVDFAFENPEVQKTRAVLVVYKDHIVAERYGDGFDENSILIGWSMTKSLVSTMFGVLAKEGKISLDDKAPIAAWQDDKRREITIKDLLQMSSGLAWEEDYGTISDATKMLFLDVDMSLSAVNKPLKHAPGSFWYYSSGTSNLLSGIVRQQFQNHQEYLDFPYATFIDKIGMHSMILEADLTGNFVGSSYSWATARDWTKFGLLYLHNGNWNGEQVIEESWVDFVRKPVENSNGLYGGHFWLNAGGKMPDVPRDAYSANGFQGQRVLIIPSKDMVIVRLGLSEEPEFDFNGFFGGVEKAVE